MKKSFLVLAILILLLSNCTINIKNPSQRIYKYKIGDIVYLKPDSLKCVIRYLNKNNENGFNYDYEVKYYLFKNVNNKIIINNTRFHNDSENPVNYEYIKEGEIY